MLDFSQHSDLLCSNHATYCLFELVSSANQENLSWLNASCELQLLFQSHAFCQILSEIKS